jgi:hypothetical protein
MNCDVFRFVTFDEVLGFVSRGVVNIAFEAHIGNNFLYDDATNSPRFRVPLNVVATFECLDHPTKACSSGVHLASAAGDHAERFQGRQVTVVSDLVRC